MTARTYSFEFFPPKTPEGEVKLRGVRTRLAALEPDYFSVTFGAGGATREGTWSTVQEIHKAGLPVAPHISCVGSGRASIGKLLTAYREAGIRRLVALRGDAPSGTGVGGGELAFASELVEFVRAQSGDWFHIDVAAYPEYHPQARSPDEDLEHFVRKVRAGANSAITQYFYNADAYFRFCDEARARGCAVPIVPGVMPITNFAQLTRFSDACGAEIPRWIRNKLASYGDDRESIRAFGLDVVSGLCERLLAQGAPGLHIFTMNLADASLEIWRRLGLPR
ncbi:MAG TPA: methylenetetrahydrofolate reductase [NAD(P)H] [Burkholderiaceae bacterium]|nr:methylenetetrahydrofolate reductase [NAD(P)H] [Burkholderiaceae bacterium]